MKFVRYLKIIKSQKYPFRFLVSRFLKYSGIWRLVVFSVHNYKLRLHPASISLSLWVNPKERADDCSFIRSVLRPGDIYIDVGANIGQLVIEGAKAVGDTGLVLAFEPHPKIAYYLYENTKLNGLRNVIIIPLAVGADLAFTKITDQGSDDQNRIADIGVGITMAPLWLFLKGFERVRLVKIDVEGYEIEVLRGLGECLRRVEVVYFEVSDEHFNRYGYSFEKIHDLLSQYNFEIYRMEDGKLLEVLRNAKFKEATNLIALNKDGARKCVELPVSGR